MTEKTVAFLVARLNSSRMPAKHFRRIGAKTVIEWIVDQLKSCTELDEIVLTTVAERGNEPLRAFAEREKISCYWYEGQADHVTTRLYKAAVYHGAEICVLVSGDCPLIYGPAIDLLLQSFKRNRQASVLQVDTLNGSDPPALYGVEIARLEAWEKAERLSDRPELKEHHFPAIGLHPEQFVIHKCVLPRHLYAPFHRLFVDTWADLEFLNRVNTELSRAGKKFHLPEVLDLLAMKQELRIINQHVHQRRLIEDIKKVLMIIDAGGEFGYGHLMRSLELALQIVERLSWPVMFLVDDTYAGTMIENRGLKVVYGAFQRLSRHSSNAETTQKTLTDIEDYDLVILDIAKRPVTSTWKEEFLPNIPVVVIDKMVEWTYEADLVIIPGVTASKEKVIEWKCKQGNSAGRIFSDARYIIIRREIRYAKELNSKKDIDLLIYLHDSEHISKLMKIIGEYNLKIHVVDGQTDSFPELLARSRFFAGQFGYSFYEALYLDCLPLSIDGNKQSADDSAIFYASFGIAKPVLGTAEDWKRYFQSRHNESKYLDATVAIKDGTPLLVEEIRCLATVS